MIKNKSFSNCITKNVVFDRAFSYLTTEFVATYFVLVRSCLKNPFFFVRKEKLRKLSFSREQSCVGKQKFQFFTQKRNTALAIILPPKHRLHNIAFMSCPKLFFLQLSCLSINFISCRSIAQIAEAFEDCPPPFACPRAHCTLFRFIH